MKSRVDKLSEPMNVGRVISCLVMVAVLLLAAGCSRGTESFSPESSNEGPANLGSSADITKACAVALANHVGDTSLDREISRLQQEAQRASDAEHVLERLGWLFVSKARISYDPGYYKLAEQCALCLESKLPNSPAALLLRGHVMHNLHRFKEAERLALELVAIRGLSFDYGLLGDVLMEQGQLVEAVDAYQSMVNLKPDIHAYSRIAHMRWLKGDLEGAIAVMEMAARAGSPRNPEPAAWAYTRLALYELQAGASQRALQACDVALDFQNNYAPALLVRGRILLSENQVDEAVEALSDAATLNPLPEYQWALAEALGAAGRTQQAHGIEIQVKQQGATVDPRTLSLYLATRDEDVHTAVRLAQRELETRADIFTLDALAWSLKAAGKMDEARSAMRQALAERTEEARLFFHAGVIAAAVGENEEAIGWLERAHEIRQMLLPSERDQLVAALFTIRKGTDS